MEYLSTLNGYLLFAYLSFAALIIWLLGVVIFRVIPSFIEDFIQGCGKLWRGEEMKSWDRSSMWGLPMLLIYGTVIFCWVYGTVLVSKTSDTATSTPEITASTTEAAAQIDASLSDMATDTNDIIYKLGIIEGMKRAE